MTENRADIWRLQLQLDNQGLIDALKQEDVAIRRRAAAALRAVGAKEAVPEIRRALVNEQDPDVKAILASALETLSDMNEDVLTANIQMSENLAHINGLIEQLDNEDPAQIMDAAYQLGEIGDQIAVEPLVLVFNSHRSSVQVKLAVAEALLKLDGAPVEVALLAALRHNDWHIRRNGAAILGQLRAEWAIEPLGRALRDEHSTVRRTARAALLHIGTPEALETIQRHPSNKPKKPSAGDHPSDTMNPIDGIPSAPRDGLLNRLRAQQEAYGKPDDEVLKHQMPTKPLDPNVVRDYLDQHTYPHPHKEDADDDYDDDLDDEET